MALTLTDDECAALEQALEYYLPQLQMESARAEARDARHVLNTLETKLGAIRDRLANVHATPAAQSG